jgi:hypothetical protein
MPANPFQLGASLNAADIHLKRAVVPQAMKKL